MIINVLISTLDEGINGISQVLLEQRSDVHYTVIHQITDRDIIVPHELASRSDVLIIRSHEKGLSKSRNLALKHAKGDVGLLADDDVRYTDETFDIIRKAYQKYPDMDIACFKIRTAIHEPEYKSYHPSELAITTHPPHFISSVETTFRIRSLQQTAISFDERFGIGSGMFTSGEETIFIYDCLKKGLGVRYFPEYIVEHPFESSGKTETRIKYITVGAVNARTQGYRSLLITVKGFASKLRRIFNGSTNPFLYLLYNLKGNFMILIKPNENRIRP